MSKKSHNIPNKATLEKWLYYLEDYQRYLQGQDIFKGVVKEVWGSPYRCLLCRVAESCNRCIWTMFSGSPRTDGVCQDLWKDYVEKNLIVGSRSIAKGRESRNLNFILWRLPILRKQISYIKWHIARAKD